MNLYYKIIELLLTGIVIGSKQSNNSVGNNIPLSRPKLGGKNVFYSSQPYLIASNVQQKIGVYHNIPIRPNIKTIDHELNQIMTGFSGIKANNTKRPTSKSRKRRRPKSYKKKRSFNFLDNYVTEQYKEYRRKESHNNLRKTKTHKQIGIPPLPTSDDAIYLTSDRRRSASQDDVIIENHVKLVTI
jgi:hypothetical protein